MLISLNWIKDFVALPDLPPKELASKFTLSTAEVEDVVVKGESLKPILCVEIKSLKPHPDSDKLNLVTFDYGGGKTKEVVCGAPNLAPGQRVPFAPIGTTLPNGMTLEPKKIRGILSDGMLCSETELGLGEGTSGLMKLGPDATPGMSIIDYLKLDSDVILDVDNKSLTHRPDLWGYLGLAREFAASHKLPLKNPYGADWAKKIESKFTAEKSPVTFTVDPTSSCLAYLGVSLDGIKMGETPGWMKNRLESAGLRSINLIVDISNYVMVELGIPNHVFDREAIKGGSLKIARLGTEAVFKTLDEVDRKLIASDTVIADSERPLVLAGIMGGLNSGVTDSTSKIFIEVANWEAPEVRKSSVRLGLRTDSSQRYEKTLDSNLCHRTLLRMVELITELCPGSKVVGGVETYLADGKNAKDIELKITQGEITRALGMEVSAETIQGIFERLDFKVTVSGTSFNVVVPSFRTTKDISQKADLIEEIGRMIGYDNITPVSPLLPVRPIRLSETKKFHRRIQDFLVYEARALQVMTYPLTGKDLLQTALWPATNENLVLVNSLSVEHDRMRPSLIPSALEMASQNQKHFDEFSFFELGRSYEGFENERSQLLIGLYSKEKSRFVELENIVEKLLSALNLNFTLTGPSEKFKNTLFPKEWSGLHPHEYQNVQIMGKFLGGINSVHPLVLRNFKMKGHLSLAVIDITDLEGREAKDKTKYSPLSKFPSSSFDVTVVVSSKDPAAAPLQALSSVKAKELKSKKIVDLFKINEDQTAVTLRAVFEDSEKTLPPETIKELEQKIIQALEKSGFPLRG